MRLNYAVFQPHDKKISWAGFSKREKELSSYRTEHGAEVDFIVTSNGETLAIESKASRNVGRSDLRGLDSFTEYYGKPPPLDGVPFGSRTAKNGARGGSSLAGRA